MSFLKNFKSIIKSNFPNLVRVFIKIRDNNYLFRILRRSYFISPSKKIHGKKIVNSEKGILLDLSVDNYVSYTFRPKKHNNLKTNNEVYDNSSTAIIVQGPLYGFEKYVRETLLLYSRIFSNVMIILSTWKDECNIDFQNEFKNYKNIKLLLNEKPKNSDNIDLQILSTFAALKFIDERGIKYCLKTRTDCRIHKKIHYFF